jgi:hypothetical protein
MVRFAVLEGRPLLSHRFEFGSFHGDAAALDIELPSAKKPPAQAQLSAGNLLVNYHPMFR